MSLCAVTLTNTPEIKVAAMAARKSVRAKGEREVFILPDSLWKRMKGYGKARGVRGERDAPENAPVELWMRAARSPVAAPSIQLFDGRDFK
jgi:hypothetical protein